MDPATNPSPSPAHATPSGASSQPETAGAFQSALAGAAQSPSTRLRPSELSIVAYVRLPDGRVTFSDEFLSAFFDKMVEERIARMVFDDHITEGWQFVEFVHAALDAPPRIIPVFMFEGMDVIGMAWLNDLCVPSAFANFVVLRRAWGKAAYTIGRAVIDHWFSWEVAPGKPMLRVLVGVTPANNRLALSFIRRLGFTRLGKIPHILEGKGAVISYLERT